MTDENEKDNVCIVLEEKKLNWKKEKSKKETPKRPR